MGFIFVAQNPQIEQQETAFP